MYNVNVFQDNTYVQTYIIWAYITLQYLQVDTKAAGKAAIHCACAQGNVEVVRCLLEFTPDLEIKVCMCWNFCITTYVL